MGLLLNKSKSFEWKESLLFFGIGGKKWSSYMGHIIKHINSSNKKTHSYAQMRKILFNLGSNKQKKMTPTHDNSPYTEWVIMSIVDTPEKDLSNIDQKSDTRRVCTSSVK